MILKMADSHLSLDCLSPSSSSSSSSESGDGTFHAKVNRIRVQPHRVSKEKKPILGYDSNDDIYPTEFNASYTLTGTAAIPQVNDFDASFVSPEQVFMDDFTIVTQEKSGRFPQETQEDIGQFHQATQEITDRIAQANQEEPATATPDNHGRFNKVPPLDSGQFSQVNGGQNGKSPIPIFFHCRNRTFLTNSHDCLTTMQTTLFNYRITD